MDGRFNTSRNFSDSWRAFFLPLYMALLVITRSLCCLFFCTNVFLCFFSFFFLEDEHSRTHRYTQIQTRRCSLTFLCWVYSSPTLRETRRLTSHPVSDLLIWWRWIFLTCPVTMAFRAEQDIVSKFLTAEKVCWFCSFAAKNRRGAWVCYWRRFVFLLIVVAWNGSLQRLDSCCTSEGTLICLASTLNKALYWSLLILSSLAGANSSGGFVSVTPCLVACLLSSALVLFTLHLTTHAVDPSIHLCSRPIDVDWMGHVVTGLMISRTDCEFVLARTR